MEFKGEEKAKSGVTCARVSLRITARETGRDCCVRARESAEDDIDNEFQHPQRGDEGKWVSGALESAHP